MAKSNLEKGPTSLQFFEGREIDMRKLQEKSLKLAEVGSCS